MSSFLLRKRFTGRDERTMISLRLPRSLLSASVPLALSALTLLSNSDSLGAQQLIRAAKSGQLERTVALLSESPHQVDLPDEAGYTALRWAGIRGHGEIATRLLEAGADPNTVGADGGTPLHGAAHHDDAALMTLLLEAGGDVSVRNRWGRTPLHVAARRGCLEVADLLLEAGADPGATTNEGWSVLNVAYRGGHPEMVRLILERGGDPGQRDSEGMLPGDVTLVRPEPATLGRRELDSFVGRYGMGGGAGFHVWRVGDRMFLMEFAPDEIVPVAPDTFYAKQEPWRIVFRRDVGGSVAGMEVGFLRRTVSAEKEVDVSAGRSYVGSESCQLCHSTPGGGGPFGLWHGSRHRHAWETLTTDQARALAASRTEYRDITDPSREQRCLMCHLTAAQNPFSEWRPGVSPTDEGVGCEACHGPGSDYSDPDIMSDSEAFLAKGGKIPDELTCRECHRDEGFDYERRLARLKHWN